MKKLKLSLRALNAMEIIPEECKSKGFSLIIVASDGEVCKTIIGGPMAFVSTSIMQVFRSLLDVNRQAAFAIAGFFVSQFSSLFVVKGQKRTPTEGAGEAWSLKLED
jgi:hypothetical protein